MKKLLLSVIILIAVFTPFNAVFAQNCEILIPTATDLINEAENASERGNLAEAQSYITSAITLLAPCSDTDTCSVSELIETLDLAQYATTLRELNNHLSSAQEILDICGEPLNLPVPTIATLNTGELMSFVGIETFVNGVDINPAGTQIATNDSDYSVRVWDITTGEEIQQLGAPNTAHSDLGMAVEFSPNGRFLASSDFNGEVKLWDLSTGEIRHEWEHDGYVWHVAFNPAGSLLASVGSDGFLNLWNVRNGNNTRTIRTGSSSVRGVEFSPNGRQILTGAEDGDVVLWNTDSGERLLTLSEHEDSANAVTFSPDGNRAASIDSGGILIIWDLVTGDVIHAINAHTSQAFALAWLSNDTIITGADDSNLIVWDAQTGDSIATQNFPSRYIRSIAVTPDESAVLLGMNDGTVLLIEIPQG
jgi:WD40 repeat protein